MKNTSILEKAILGLMLLVVAFAGIARADESTTAQLPTLFAFHTPAAPTTASTLAISAIAHGGAVSDVKIYLDGAALSTAKVCDPSCRFIARKSGLAEGNHTYYATGNAAGNGTNATNDTVLIIYSNNGTVSVTGKLPKLTVSHSPASPVEGENITITTFSGNGSVSNGKIYFDGEALTTVEFCTASWPARCGFTAVKANASAGTHKYNATGTFGARTVASETGKVTVRKIAPVVDYFDATPAEITLGDSSLLSWSVPGARFVTISQGIGKKGAAGEIKVTPKKTTTYTLTAHLVSYGKYYNGHGNRGKTIKKSVTVKVVPAAKLKLELSLSPEKPTTGDNITLSAKSKDGLFDEVVIYLDGKAVKTSTTCTENINSSCIYSASVGQLKSGEHRFYTAGMLSGRKAVSEVRKFTVSSSDLFLMYNIPSTPRAGEMVTITAIPMTSAVVSDVKIYLDGSEQKTTSSCPQNANSSSPGVYPNRCKYVAITDDLSAGKHKYYATAKSGDKEIRSVLHYLKVREAEEDD